MIKNREGYLVSDSERQCTNCFKIFKKTSKTVTLCNICNSNRVKSNDIRKKIINRAKNRAKNKNLEFNITYEDVIIPEICPILQIPLITSSGKPGGKKNSPSIDRIDNTKGYVKGNIRIISQLANCMKSFANEKELLKFANWILVNYNLVDSNQID